MTMLDKNPLDKDHIQMAIFSTVILSYQKASEDGLTSLNRKGFLFIYAAKRNAKC
jgi:hypothetical protein